MRTFNWPTQLLEFEAERNAGEAREGLLQLESEQVRTRLVEIDELLRSTRQQLDAARDRRGELSATAAKLQSDLQHLADTCLNELGMERSVLMADTTIAAGHRRMSWQSKTRPIAKCAPASTPWDPST